jgi:hypothetical protein
MNYTHKQHRIIITEETNELQPRRMANFYATIHDSRVGWNVHETDYYPTAYKAATVAVGIINNRMRVTKNTVIR